MEPEVEPIMVPVVEGRELEEGDDVGPVKAILQAPPPPATIRNLKREKAWALRSVLKGVPRTHFYESIVPAPHFQKFSLPLECSNRYCFASPGLRLAILTDHQTCLTGYVGCWVGYS